MGTNIVIAIVNVISPFLRSHLYCTCMFCRKHILWPGSLIRFLRSASSRSITCSSERKWRSSCPSSFIRSVSDAPVCICSRFRRAYLLTRRGADLSSGVGAMTWSPLACGIISGKYDSGVPPYSRASLKVTHEPLCPSSSCLP